VVINRENNKAQEALQVSEANFRNSMENSPLGIRIVSEDGETLYTNRAFLNIYGYQSIEEFNTTLVKTVILRTAILNSVRAGNKRRRREPLPDNYEVSIVRKDVKFAATGCPQGNPMGGKLQYQRFTRMLPIISKQKKPCKQVKQYHELVDTITSGVFIYKAVDNGEDFVFVNVNSAAEKMEGLTGQMLLVRSKQRFYPGREVIPGLQFSGESGKREILSIIHPARSKGPVAGQLDLQIAQRWNCNVYNDITDKKLAEESLKDRKLASATLWIIHHWVFVSSIWKANLYANQALLTIFGYETADE